MEATNGIQSDLQFIPAATASGCATAQFSFDHYISAPGRVTSMGLRRHTMLFNQGDPLAISYYIDQQWKTFIASPNTTICILPAGTQFEMRWTQSLQVLVFSFEDSFAKAIAQSRAFDFLPQWNLTDGLLEGLAERISAVANASSFSELKYIESLAIACVDQVNKQYRASSGEQPKGRLSPRQLTQVIAFAHDCMELDIGLVELANLVHLSPYHFGRLFKQTIGLSPYQYLLQLRIEFAKKLIIERAGPLADIAYQLNFSDQAHFSNAFRKATGISPRKYLQSQALA